MHPGMFAVSSTSSMRSLIRTVSGISFRKKQFSFTPGVPNVLQNDKADKPIPLERRMINLSYLLIDPTAMTSLSYITFTFVTGPLKSLDYTTKGKAKVNATIRRDSICKQTKRRMHTKSHDRESKYTHPQQWYSEPQGQCQWPLARRNSTQECPW